VRTSRLCSGINAPSKLVHQKNSYCGYSYDMVRFLRGTSFSESKNEALRSVAVALGFDLTIAKDMGPCAVRRLPFLFDLNCSAVFSLTSNMPVCRNVSIRTETLSSWGLCQWEARAYSGI